VVKNLREFVQEVNMKFYLFLGAILVLILADNAMAGKRFNHVLLECHLSESNTDERIESVDVVVAEPVPSESDPKKDLFGKLNFDGDFQVKDNAMYSSVWGTGKASLSSKKIKIKDNSFLAEDPYKHVLKLNLKKLTGTLRVSRWHGYFRWPGQEPIFHFKVPVVCQETDEWVE
jgi:hypothetical protein